MIATFRLQAASLHQANVDWMSSCLYSTRCIVIRRASRPVVGCSYVGVFPGVFPYGRHPRFRDFDPVVPVDVVRVEADLDRFLDSASVPVQRRTRRTGSGIPPHLVFREGLGPSAAPGGCVELCRI